MITGALLLGDTVFLGYIPLWIVLLGVELPALLALVACTGRPPEHFAGGAADRKGWQRCLVVAVLTVPILVGFLIVIGYSHVVVRRNSPYSRG